MRGSIGRPMGALLAMAVILGIAAHLFALRLVTTHLALPAVAAVGVVALVAISHAGAAAWAWLRRRPGSRAE